MKPAYLKFADEAEAAKVLDGLDLAARDDVGVIYPPMADDKQPEPLDGWHVNVMLEGDVPESLQPYVVTPDTPARRFAGW